MRVFSSTGGDGEVGEVGEVGADTSSSVDLRTEYLFFSLPSKEGEGGVGDWYSGDDAWLPFSAMSSVLCFTENSSLCDV